MADEPLNPYVSPQNLEAVIAAAKPGTAAYAPQYVPARGKANWAIGAAALTIGFQVLLLISCFMQLSMLQSAVDGPGYDDAAANSNQTRQLTTAALVGVGAIAALITLLVWIYAANANLPALGNRWPDFSPGWSVGWFFIPFMNLFKPYQIVSELWRDSDPAIRKGKLPTGLGLVGWWWCWRVLSAIAEHVSNTIGRDTESVEGLIILTWAFIALILILDIPMLAMQALVILRIQRFQEERHSLISIESSPPDFRDPLAAFPV